MIRILLRIDDQIQIIESILIVLLFAGLILLTGLNIFSRNLLGISYRQIFEVSPAIVLWLSLLGSTLALKRDRHIRIEILLRFLPVTWQRHLHRLVAVFGIVLMTVLAWTSLDFVHNEILIFGVRGLYGIVFPVFFILSGFRFTLKALISNEILYSGPKSGRDPL